MKAETIGGSNYLLLNISESVLPVCIGNSLEFMTSLKSTSPCSYSCLKNN